MQPNEKLNQIRKSEDLSKEKFASKFGFKGYLIDNIELGKQNIPDDLALKLEKEYNIPFKWWKTGIGNPYFDGNSLKKQKLSLLDEYNNWGSRLCQCQTEMDLNYTQMSKLLGISESRLDEIYNKSPEPRFKEIIAIQENIDVSLSWLLFGILPSQKATQEHPKNNNLDVLSSLSPDKMNKLLDLLEN